MIKKRTLVVTKNQELLIEISPHARLQIKERGVLEDEVIIAIRHGEQETV